MNDPKTSGRRRCRTACACAYSGKPDFQRSYAVLAACYGGADRRFRVGDTWTDTPAGVAHYLEHKLFDMPDGPDALTALCGSGASRTPSRRPT